MLSKGRKINKKKGFLWFKDRQKKQGSLKYPDGGLSKILVFKEYQTIHKGPGGYLF